jgi:hypothetical protein
LVVLYHVFDGRLGDAFKAYSREAWGWLARLVVMPPPDNAAIMAWAGLSDTKRLTRTLDSAIKKLGCGDRLGLNAEVEASLLELHRRQQEAERTAERLRVRR